MTILRNLCKGKIINPGDYYVDHYLVRMSAYTRHAVDANQTFYAYTVRTNLVRNIPLPEV